MISRILFSVFVLSAAGCAHIHDNIHHGGYYYHGSPLHYYHGHYPGFYNYSPRYSSTYAPTYNYSVREYNRQNINNSININGPRTYEVVTRQTRSFYIDDTAAAMANLQDGTLQQINLVEQQKHVLPLCQTAIQSVIAKNYNSFQFTSCQ